MSLKKIFLFLFCSFIVGQHAFAQPPSRKDPQLRAIKVGLLSDRMKLTPNQSQQFWAVYMRYEDDMSKVWAAKREYNDPKNPKSKSPNKVDQLQRLDEQKVQIKGRYKNEFLKVISTTQLGAMYEAEQEFKKMLLERLNK